MILHIIIDSVFVSKGVSTFERILPKNNLSLIVGKNNTYSYLEFQPDIKIKSYLDFIKLKNIKKIWSSDGIILHSLSPASIIVSILARKRTKIHWIGWGYDYYSLFNERGYVLLGTETQKLQDCLEKEDKGSIRTQINKLVERVLLPFAIKKITSFSPVIWEDYELFLQYYPKTHIKYYPWNYGSSNPENCQFELLSLGNNILLGNSASNTNNHLEIFNILKNINLKGRKLIVPLSYGERPCYVEAICKKGYELFGENFVPLREFIEFSKYQEILLSCSVVIMNHYRQQAVGNILLMLKQGSKIFLNDRNPYFISVIKMGAVIYTIDELIANPEIIDEPLSKSNKLNNWKVYRSFKPQETLDLETETIINVLLE